MLTTDQVDHFRTFGFVVLRGYLADRDQVGHRRGCQQLGKGKAAGS